MAALANPDATGVGRYAETTPIGARWSDYMNMGLDAVRDGLIRQGGLPLAVNLSDRDALAFSVGGPVQGMRIARKDLGYTERYLEVYSASANPRGARVAGWYPAGLFARFLGSQRGGAWNAGANLGFATLLDDPYAGWNPAANEWRAPVAGTYAVSAGFKQSSAVAAGLLLQLNGATVHQTPDARNVQYSGAEIPGRWLRLVAGDRLALRTTLNVTLQADGAADNSFLSIVQVQE